MTTSQSEDALPGATGWGPDPWPPPEFAAEVAAAVGDYLRTDGRLSLPAGGGPVEHLEHEFARMAGTRHALTVTSGTAALHTAYLALGIGRGDEVLASPYSFHATVTPLLHVGARPVFADIDASTGNLDPASLTGRITARTRAIVVTHMYGRPADMVAINQVARRHDLVVVEDCSHAHGASLHGRPVGSWGHVGVFSLQANKLAPAGEGGMLTTDDSTLFERALLVGHFGPRALGISDPSLRRYGESGFGLKLRLHPLAAVAGLCGLQMGARVREGRLSHARAVADRVRELPSLSFDFDPAWAFYLFRLLLSPDVPSEQRARLLELAERADLPLRMASLRPITELPIMREGVSLAGATWEPVDALERPGTISFTERCLSMPTWYSPTSESRRESYLDLLGELVKTAAT